MIVEAPKIEYKILPSLTPEQIDSLLENADCVRDKAIISLFADSGLRLAEMASIRIVTSHVLELTQINVD
ncbi:MAG: hypothetical protein JSU76_03325 [Dehalococcoidia bacterium]|nr:MAG: hypothetical protein JSU76_03325 [Dehalococcoidia bacterium]